MTQLTLLHNNGDKEVLEGTMLRELNKIYFPSMQDGLDDHDDDDGHCWVLAIKYSPLPPSFPSFLPYLPPTLPP
jgi:hypothetical protein